MSNTEKQKNIYITIVAFLAILIPTPGRFVYVFTVIFEMALLMVLGTLLDELIKKLKLTHLKTVLLMMIILFISVFYRQIIVILHPEVALVLGFVLYLPPISLFLMGFLYRNNDLPLKNRLLKNSILILTVIIFGLIFFLIRDILGYGTFTFFGNSHQIYEKVILTSDKLGIFSFLASIPGSLMLLGLFLYLHIFVSQKINIIKNAEVQK
ncbi:MAG: hypothetical protein SOT46_09420 [Treponema sp.]|nr:hypothetical protein [Treponema sp.]